MLMMRSFSLIVLLLLLSACARTHKTESVAPPAGKRIVQHRKVSAFNQVTVEGNINVNLHTGYSRPQVILHGDSRDLIQLKSEVTDNGLRLTIGKGYPRFGAITADIRGRYLNSFSFKGVGFIKGNNLHSGLLDLSIDNPGRTTLGGSIFLRKLKVSGGGDIQLRDVNSQYLHLAITDKTRVMLTGVLNLSKVNLDGDGFLSVYWVKSMGLIVCAKGNTFVQLAGVVDKLDLELWGLAQFKGRYLRVRRAFVKTHGKSIAEITALQHQD